MTARWDDGLSWNISGLSVEKWRNKYATRRSTSQERLWADVHSCSNNTLHLSQRTDHGLLLSFYAQARQICSIQVKSVGPAPEPQPAVAPKDKETLQKGLAFCLPLCDMYAAGLVADAKELKKMRDEKQKGNRHLAAKAVRKRPAATPEATTTTEATEGEGRPEQLQNPRNQPGHPQMPHIMPKLPNTQAAQSTKLSISQQ